MKKFINIILFITLCMLTNMVRVNAVSTVNRIWIENFYSYKEVEGKPPRDYVGFAYIYVDGNIAYCIEPGISLIEGNYQLSDNFESINLTDEDKKYLELVAIYGYSYPGHQTEKYYAATQELIWEKLGVKNILWSTTRDGNNIIDLSIEKNEIQKLVTNHDKLPSFYDDLISLNYKQETILIDENNILENYEIIDSDLDVKMIDNNIQIDTSKLGEFKIKLKRKNLDEGVSLIYTKENSQNVAILKLGNPKYIELNIKIIGKNFSIYKVDEVTNEPISDVTFNVFDNNSNELVYEGITNENGALIIDNLYNGEFYAIETKAADGYQLTDVKYYFTINDDDENTKLYISNKKVEVPDTGISKSQVSDTICIILIILGIISFFYEKFKNKY